MTDGNDAMGNCYCCSCPSKVRVASAMVMPSIELVMRKVKWSFWSLVHPENDSVTSLRLKPIFIVMRPASSPRVVWSVPSASMMTGRVKFGCDGFLDFHNHVGRGIDFLHRGEDCSSGSHILLVRKTAR